MLPGAIAVAAFLVAGVRGTPALAESKADIDPRASEVEYDPADFGPDPAYEEEAYDYEQQLGIYGGKFAVPTPRPLLELGREIYQSGPFTKSYTFLGTKNLVAPTFSIYGDWRTAVAFNDNGATELAQVATRLNLDVDLKITATERMHAFFGPLDKNGQFTRCEISGGDAGVAARGCKRITDLNPDALFFEGDMGQILAGATGEYNKLDLPFAFGLMPLLFQNGIWVEDAFTGFAATVPALNSRTLDISNMDFTVFAGFDKVTTAAVLDNDGLVADHQVNLFGLTGFVEAGEVYYEFGYGYVDADDGLRDQSYHNVTAAFSRRYGGVLSNSIRLIGNFGQDRQLNGRRNANGLLILLENSLITSMPTTLVPYFNMFFGFDKPQSLARAGGAGGVLKNTGINFETDGLTGFPKLDDTANDTYGGALGVSYLFGLDQQLVVEGATVQTNGRSNAVRVARGDEYAIGLRYQRPLTKAWIVRLDTMFGWRVRDENLGGARLEIRRKF
jgi:hypothetical protein